MAVEQRGINTVFHTPGIREEMRSRAIQSGWDDFDWWRFQPQANPHARQRKSSSFATPRDNLLVRYQTVIPGVF